MTNLASSHRPADRFAAIDVLRGLVMVIMAIDHASEVFNGGRNITDSVMFYTPGTPLPVAQFLTRWLTHLCAPTFVTLAGAALAIATERRQARGEAGIDRWIVTRGLMLVFFEVAWMSWVMVGPGRVLLQVLYAIGTSLVAMALLRRLGDRALLALGLAIVFGAEVLVGVLPRERLPVAMLVSGGVFFDWKLVAAYPTLPWLGMMCLGWVLGRQVVAGRDLRRLLVIAGASGLGLFVVLRGLNGYGNMRLLRESQELVQWLHVSKYPPSATFICLELGIAALLLAFFVARPIGGPLRKLGQTALFFYLLHIHLLDLFAKATGLHGKLGLKSAFIGGFAIVLVLYPACLWYGRYKARHPSGWARWI